MSKNPSTAVFQHPRLRMKPSLDSWTRHSRSHSHDNLQLTERGLIMANPRLENIVLSDTRIFFRNFSGQPDKYNRTGARTFACEVPPEFAAQMEADGINVKYSKDVDGNPDPERPYIAVKVRFDVKPPKIYMVEDGVKTLLSEETVGVLDSADIVRADLVITPVFYDVNGNTGFSNYLKTAYITIEADEFASRYADMETR
nr:MAG TPA: hypothetical protein [Caudoviricetes sp.]